VIFFTFVRRWFRPRFALAQAPPFFPPHLTCPSPPCGRVFRFFLTPPDLFDERNSPSTGQHSLLGPFSLFFLLPRVFLFFPVTSPPKGPAGVSTLGFFLCFPCFCPVFSLPCSVCLMLKMIVPPFLLLSLRTSSFSHIALSRLPFLEVP